MRTDGQTGITKLIVTFRNFVNPLKTAIFIFINIDLNLNQNAMLTVQSVSVEWDCFA